MRLLFMGLRTLDERAGAVESCAPRSPGRWRAGASDLRAVIDLEFDHLLPAHGAVVSGGAKAKFRPSIDVEHLAGVVGWFVAFRAGTSARKR